MAFFMEVFACVLLHLLPSNIYKWDRNVWKEEQKESRLTKTDRIQFKSTYSCIILWLARVEKKCLPQRGQCSRYANKMILIKLHFRSVMGKNVQNRPPTHKCLLNNMIMEFGYARITAYTLNSVLYYIVYLCNVVITLANEMRIPTVVLLPSAGEWVIKAWSELSKQWTAMTVRDCVFGTF